MLRNTLFWIELREKKDGSYRQVLDLARRQERAGRTTLVSNAVSV
jgi:hypothetical protein